MPSNVRVKFVDLAKLRSYFGCGDPEVSLRARGEWPRQPSDPGRDEAFDSALREIVDGAIPAGGSRPAAAYVHAVEALCSLCEGAPPHPIPGTSADLDAALDTAGFPAELRLSRLRRRPPLPIPLTDDPPWVGTLTYEEAVDWARRSQTRVYALGHAVPLLVRAFDEVLDYHYQMSGAADRQSFLDEDEEAPPPEDQYGLVFFYD